MFRYRLLLALALFLSGILEIEAQDDFKLLFLEPQVKAGLIVPNADFYPDPSLQRGFALNIGGLNSKSDLAKQLRFAPTGVQLGYTNYGNQKVYGESYQIVPFMSVRCANRVDRVLDFRFGLGASYFTTHYDSVDNTANKSIGSAFNWNFHAFLYYTIITGDKRALRLGAGYSHHSNGHVQLPNFGLNSALLSLSYSFQNISFDRIAAKIAEERVNVRDQMISLQARQGIGFQEFGGTIGPVGGDKAQVYTTAVAVSIDYRKFVKVSAGMAYRYYEHYRNYIDSTQVSEFVDRPQLNSSAIYFFMGLEMYLGHLGVEMNGGINLFKPFHSTYNDLFEGNSGLGYFMKRYIPTRLSMNLYAFKPSKYPSLNVFVSASMNANFGEADFGEFGFGLTKKLKHRSKNLNESTLKN
jgi:hypothetical protein